MPAHTRLPVHGTASGEAYWGPGDRYLFHVTGAESGDSVFALDCLVGPGGGPPPHRHLAEDELFFLYEGSIEFNAAEKTYVVSAGEAIFVPKALPTATETWARVMRSCTRSIRPPEWRAGSAKSSSAFDPATPKSLPRLPTRR
jgi:hypothetical protein